MRKPHDLMFEVGTEVQIKPGYGGAGTVFKITKIWIDTYGKTFVEGSAFWGPLASFALETKREWHGCTNRLGHRFEDGKCEDCELDLSDDEVPNERM